MKKTNLVTITINGVEIQCTQEQAIAIATACGATQQSVGKTSEKSTKSSKTSSPKKSAPAKATAELVEFKKADGTVRTVSAKQAAAWEAYRDRAQNRMSLDEVKAVPMPKITKDVKSFVKANPGCSAKQVKAQFPSMKGLQREQLAALKKELGVR